MSNNTNNNGHMMDPGAVALTGLGALVLAPFTGGSSLGIWACHVGCYAAHDALKDRADNKNA